MTTRTRVVRAGVAGLGLWVIVLAGCADGDPAAPTASTTAPGTGATAAQAPVAGADGPTTGAQRHPDVLDARLTRDGDGWSLAVTLSSPYDTPERYADGWRVLDDGGTVLGTHELAHDHADEQPFTRTQRGLEIPDGVDTVTVEGRDLRNGYGGATVTIEVPR